MRETPGSAVQASPGAASAALTRGSASSSATTSALPFLCAKYSGVSPSCRSGDGRIAISLRRVPLRAPNIICGDGIGPRGREEEGNDRGVTIASRHMQRGGIILQG